MPTYTIRRVERNPMESHEPIEITEYEKVFDSWVASPTRLIVYILTPACGENDCSRHVDEPGDKCWQHTEDDEE